MVSGEALVENYEHFLALNKELCSTQCVPIRFVHLIIISHGQACAPFLAISTGLCTY